MALPPRFWLKAVEEGDCWVWIAALDTKGRGSYWQGGGMRSAYKVAYVDKYGPVPDGLELDHVCGQPRCVRPDHLEPVTHRENCIRANPPKTHCPHGHALEGVNVFHDGQSRKCRQCVRRASREYMRRKRERKRLESE